MLVDKAGIYGGIADYGVVGDGIQEKHAVSSSAAGKHVFFTQTWFYPCDKSSII